MKPPPFNYVAAATVDHAVELLNGDTDARVIAGGQSLMPLLNLRLASPELVVDIGRIDALNTITVDGEGLTIGAAVTQAKVAGNTGVLGGWPLLVEAIGLIGHAQIRNRGTLCGSLAHNDPLAELPAVSIALDASVTVSGPNGERVVPIDDLLTGPFMTSLEPGELITSAHYPTLRAETGWAISEFATRTGDFATAGVVTRLIVEGGVARDSVVVLFGLGPGPQRSAVVEAAINGASTPSLSEAVLAQLDASIHPNDDVHATADARREFAARLATESVSEAWAIAEARRGGST